MKPINLEVSAFGPYKDKVLIDFSKIGNNGIFLITGDTGAGKTTIFDAIVFALFGEVSGSNRQVSSIRSDFADKNIETYVILKFSHKGKEYTIYRNPQYERPKKNGEGLTKNVADAWLKWDDKVTSGIKNVDDKIKEVLGIDVKQFKQISMLAQGEFLRVLFAESKERAEIFRRIFDTNIYNNITYELKNRRRESEEKLIQLKTSFITNSQNIRWSHQEEKELFSIKDLNQLDIKEILEKLKKDIEVKEEQEKNILSRLYEQEKEFKSIEDNYKKIKEENERIDRLNDLNRKIEILENKKSDIENDKKVIEINQKIFSKVKPIENLLEKVKKELEEIRILKDKEFCDFKVLEKDKEILAQKEMKLNDLKINFEKYQSITNEFQEVKKEITKVQDILEIFKQRKLAIRQYDMIYKEYEEISRKSKYEDDKFFREQAGIIAERLEDDKPCPVCGSTKHPCIAQKSKNVLSKEDLDKLKELEDKKANEYKNKKEVITKLNTKIETLENDLLKEKEETIEEYFEKISKDYKVLEKNINYSIDLINDIYKQITGKKISLNDFSLDKLKEEFDRDIREHLDKLTKSETLIKQYNKNQVDKEKEVQELKEKFINSYSILGFNNYEEYTKNLLDEKAVAKKQEKIDVYNTEVITTKTQIEEISKTINIKEKQDLSELETKLADDNKKLQDVRDNHIAIKSSLDNNINIQSLLMKNSKDLLRQIDIYMAYDELARTALGTLSGKRKLEFEQYVQMAYFDMIIIEANKRLVKMTDNRFLLKRKETSSKLSDKIGLDLEVIDNYNGKQRDVKSLSGGEAFKAALSLSLGVSDIIQSYSGGVVVETLFIDEGFGSLDTESREQAINTLNLLIDNNKLIGIISHVTELKERIDKKIIIEKTSEGSKVKMED